MPVMDIDSEIKPVGLDAALPQLAGNHRGSCRTTLLDGLFDRVALFCRERKRDVRAPQLSLADLQAEVLHDGGGAGSHLMGDLAWRQSFAEQFSCLIFAVHCFHWMQSEQLAPSAHLLVVAKKKWEGRSPPYSLGGKMVEFF